VIIGVVINLTVIRVRPFREARIIENEVRNDRRFQNSAFFYNEIMLLLLFNVHFFSYVS